MLNILVISGGSGNTALLQGIHNYCPSANIKILVNAYDNGKSTGVCRQVTDTLGVSDLRKNHHKLYKLKAEFYNRKIAEFYDYRVDLTSGQELKETEEYLDKWGFPEMKPYAALFFKTAQEKGITEFKDFSISNIIYSAMYKAHGYEEAHEQLCTYLGVPNDVVMNSFDNVYIQAVTQSGNVITDEGEIVEYDNPEDPIVDIQYDNMPEVSTLNPEAIDLINEADVIVLSTGTFWASLYPTFQYGELYKIINESKAKKLWVVNNTEDKDAKGVDNLKFIEYFEKLGLDVNQFTMLLNSDAVESMKKTDDEHTFVTLPMSNSKQGTHDSRKLGAAVIRFGFGILDLSNCEQILVDFDDTIWARSSANESNGSKELQTAKRNIHLLQQLNKKIPVSIVSGNSYEAVYSKLSAVIGTDFSDFDVPIWADANAVQYVKNEPQTVITDVLMTDSVDELTRILADNYGLTLRNVSPMYPTCYKIRPVSPTEQLLGADYLNNFLLNSCGLTDYVAKATGRSTIDIMHKINTGKEILLAGAPWKAENVIYIGDEITAGNDKTIASMCGAALEVCNIMDTEMFLKILLEG